MKELLEFLAETDKLVYISIETPGVKSKIIGKIEEVDEYMDGTTFYFDEGSEIFLSSLCNTVLSFEDDGEVLKYEVKTVNDTIITVLLES